MSEVSFEDLFGTPDIVHLGVSGSRNWPDEEFVYAKLQEALEKWPTITTVVSGGQPKGVDGFAKAFARRKDLAYIELAPYHYYPEDDPRYRPYHVSNFFLRNSEIVQQSDVLLAFCYQNSGGTMDTYTKARKLLGSAHVELFTEEHLEALE